MELKFYSHYNVASDCIDLFIKDETKKSVATKIIFESYTPGDRMVSPVLSLEHSEAQRLMDSLWDAGIRPIAAKGSAGQLEATKYHLEDMRKLVFNDRGSSKSIT